MNKFNSLIDELYAARGEWLDHKAQYQQRQIQVHGYIIPDEATPQDEHIAELNDQIELAETFQWLDQQPNGSGWIEDVAADMADYLDEKATQEGAL